MAGASSRSSTRPRRGCSASIANWRAAAGGRNPSRSAARRAKSSCRPAWRERRGRRSRRLEMLREGGFGLPSARVVERLGSVKSEKAISLIAVTTHHIPYVFSAATLAEAGEARAAGFRSSRRLARPAARHHRPPTLRIMTTRLRGARFQPRQCRRLYPHRRDRRRRPLRAAGLPARQGKRSSAAIRSISPTASADAARAHLNDLCSLRPDEDRPALVARMVIARDAGKLKHSFIAS